MSDSASRAYRLDRALADLLAQAPEVEAAAVVSFDGLPMASALPATMDEDRVAAMSAALLSLGERAADTVAAVLKAEPVNPAEWDVPAQPVTASVAAAPVTETVQYDALSAQYDAVPAEPLAYAQPVAETTAAYGQPLAEPTWPAYLPNGSVSPTPEQTPWS